MEFRFKYANGGTPFFGRASICFIPYFKILNLPISGSSFALPVAALIMPMIARTVITMLTRPIMLTMKYNLHEIARMIELKILYAIP